MPVFPKSERLCGKMCIKALYREGRKFVVWPVRVTFIPQAGESKTQVLIWAAKSLVRSAVGRNRLRRQMREAYRLNKEQVENLGWQVAFNYMEKRMLPYSKIESAVKKAVERLCHIACSGSTEENLQQPCDA